MTFLPKKLRYSYLGIDIDRGSIWGNNLSKRNGHTIKEKDQNIVTSLRKALLSWIFADFIANLINLKLANGAN